MQARERNHETTQPTRGRHGVSLKPLIPYSVRGNMKGTLENTRKHAILNYTFYHCIKITGTTPLSGGQLKKLQKNELK
jgi:hypothetical protein